MEEEEEGKEKKLGFFFFLCVFSLLANNIKLKIIIKN
jgi:hypothetical protein